MSTYGRLPYEEKDSEAEKTSAGTEKGLGIENSLQLDALSIDGPGTKPDANLLDLPREETQEDKKQRKKREMRERIQGANHTLSQTDQLPVDELDPALLGSAVPIPEQSMGVFDLGDGDEMQITSSGFATCVGMLLEREKPDGGKRAGFSHVNGEDPTASGLDALIEQVGGVEGLQVYLSTCDEVSKEDQTLFSVLAFLQDRNIPIAGRAQMGSPPQGSGNLMAKLSGNKSPKFSSTTDPSVELEMKAREKDMKAKNPAFETVNTAEAEFKELSDALKTGTISWEEAEPKMDALTKANTRFPMAFHPDGKQGGCSGNRWPPDGKHNPGSGGTGVFG